MRFRRRRDLVCREAVELMSDYVEGALSKHDRARLEAHLAGCPHCTRYLEQIRTTITAAGHVEPDDLPDETVDDLVALYRNWRDDIASPPA
jgi:anti-sigma factor RsiW